MRRVFLLAVILLTCASFSYAQSLWQARENSGKGSYFTDRVAHRIGDLLTILIVEQSSATTTANSDSKRTTDIKDEIKNWIKLILKGSGITRDIKALPLSSSDLPTLELSAENQYKAEGSTDRSQKLNARITAKIIETLPNGNYIIEGSQEVELNSEKQIITLTGEIRPDDISADNTILSSAIANAHISYSGKGKLGDKHGKGALEWLFDFAWLF